MSDKGKILLDIKVRAEADPLAAAEASRLETELAERDMIPFWPNIARLYWFFVIELNMEPGMARESAVSNFLAEAEFSAEQRQRREQSNLLPLATD